jgi:isoamyl acetate esterase
MKVILIGDSIRMGYQKKVQEELTGRAEVEAPEVNCGDTRRILAHLDEWVISRKPGLVHLNSGLHDLKKEHNQDQSAVPLVEYTENVRKFLQHLQAETSARIVWALTTPVNEKNHRNNKPFDRLEADVVAYNKATEQIAEKLKIPVNDLFGVIEQAPPDRVLLPDGVHFTPEGYEILGRAVANFISAWL